MNTKMRRRGRPPGTGTDDRAHLMAMARLMVADPALNRAAALREVVRSRKDWTATDDSVLHRLRVKWKAEGEDFLARARVEQVAERERQDRQERERHLREMPVLRDIAAAAGGCVTGSSWPSVAASARMLGAVDSEMLKTIQRQMAESQTLWDNHRKTISVGLAAAKAQDQATRAALAHSKHQDLEVQA